MSVGSINVVMLAGNLTRDVEMRYTPRGKPVAQFGLAVNERWKVAETGEVKEKAIFVDVTVFGKGAEFVQKYFQKGAAIFVQGKLDLDQWEDKQTKQKRSKLHVIAERVQFFGGKRPDAGGGPQEEPGANDQ